MHLVYLENQISWFGSHTGYERLPGYVEREGVAIRSYLSRHTFWTRAAGKLVSLFRGHGATSQANAFARLQTELALRRNSRALAHVLYGEEHLVHLKDISPALLDRTIVTLHHPSRCIPPDCSASMSFFRHAIVLWRRELDWFHSHMPQGQIHFIHHGVDIDFFKPGVRSGQAPPRLLYAGLHQRNPEMLARVIARLDAGRPDLHYDFLVPMRGRKNPALQGLQGHPRITWHAGLDDTQLLHLYQQAHLLLLPMTDSGANTAVVEALACGLPLVTTDVGGIRDYGGGTVFPLVENNDDDAMVSMAEDYLDRPGLRDAVGARCRAFAESTLAWPLVARQHVELYRKIAA